MKYWLIKSEPSSYSIEDMEKDGFTMWDGVRNYQARNNLKLMKSGDLAFFYRSVKKPAIVGMVKVIGEAVEDETAKEGDWVATKVEFVKKLLPEIQLKDLKGFSELEEMRLLKQSRLSVSEVDEKEWEFILNL